LSYEKRSEQLLRILGLKTFQIARLGHFSPSPFVFRRVGSTRSISAISRDRPETVPVHTSPYGGKIEGKLPQQPISQAVRFCGAMDSLEVTFPFLTSIEPSPSWSMARFSRSDPPNEIISSIIFGNGLRRRALRDLTPYLSTTLPASSQFNSLLHPDRSRPSNVLSCSTMGSNSFCRRLLNSAFIGGLGLTITLELERPRWI
jgi:hypothetical protein